MHKTMMTGLLVCMCGLAALSQDMVRLQDGTEVMGKVTEHIIGDHLRLRLADGTYQTYYDADVQKVFLDTRRRPFEMTTRGYFNHTSFNVTIGRSFASALGASFYSVNGLQWNAHWMAGVGVGLEWIRFQRLMPVMVDVQYNFMSSKGTPYIEGAAGFAVPLGDTYYDGSNNIPWWSKAFGRTYGGVAANIQFGYRHFWSKRLGYTLSGGLRYQHLSTSHPDAFFEGVQVQFASTERLNWLLGQVGVGLLFK